jgi:CheY-like chemotaxis protein
VGATERGGDAGEAVDRRERDRRERDRRERDWRAGADRGQRVLVVDDDEGVRAMLGAALEDAGYQVAAAADGEAALGAVENEPPDVILLDLMLPNVSGWDFLDAYRRSPGPHAPVVLISALKPAALQRTRLRAVDAVVPKPITLDHLLGVVGACLGARVAPEARAGGRATERAA